MYYHKLDQMDPDPDPEKRVTSQEFVKSTVVNWGR